MGTITRTPITNLDAIREAYRGTLGVWTVPPAVEDQDPFDSDFREECISNTSIASDHAREAMVAAERAVLTECGAPSERRGMVAAEHLACLAFDAAVRGESESAASYSHLYHTIRGVIQNVNF